MPSVPTALGKFYQQQPNWKACGGTTVNAECATVDVPLDYAKPDGRTIGLAVLKVPAIDQSHKLGTLFVNPGGPGGSGIQYAAAADYIVGSALRRQYDVVGWDPRGVGSSTPVTCQTTAQRDAFAAADPDPRTAAQVAEAVRLAKEFAQACEQRSGALLPYVGTTNVARDLDVLRGIVGDPELTYLGKSYGTFIGAVYAELFPTHVGRMVLDGALDPSLTSLQINLQQAKGFATAMNAWADNCVQTSCGLGGTRAAVMQSLAKVIDKAKAAPIPTGTDRKLSVGLAVSAMIYPMYSRDLWATLGPAVSQALAGNGSAMLRLADQYSSRGPSGYEDNSGEVIYAVNCLDHPTYASVPAIQKLLPQFAAAAPVLGRGFAWSDLPCAYWPVKPQIQPHKIAAAGSKPIVVVGTTRDPATPYSWAVGLAGQLQNGYLITRDGDGHTGYHEGNSCVDGPVEAYYLSGKTPQKNLHC